MEAQTNEKLLKVQTELLQMNVDQKESEREAKMRETLASLQRIFPGNIPHSTSWTSSSITFVAGVRGRLRDLIKATAHKYDIAIEVLLGRNNDAIVVDEEKTAVDCVEVSSQYLSLFYGAHILCF